MSKINMALLLATLGGLGTAIAATLQDGWSTMDLAVIGGAVGAALTALFVDRDGDGVPPLFDDSPGYALTDALGALALAGVLSWALLACGTMSSVVQAETTQAEIRADMCGSARYDFGEGSGMWALGGYLDADAGGVIKVARFLAVPVKTRLRLDGGTGDDVSEARALWCVSVFGIESCPLDAQAGR